MLAFLLWSICGLGLAGVGVAALCARKPVKFWNVCAEAPKVSDVKKYNRAVGILILVFAAAFEGLGSFFFAGQNSALMVIPILGLMFLAIFSMVVYTRIEKKYRIY